MIYNWSHWYWKLGLTSSWAIAGALAELSGGILTSSGEYAAQVVLSPIRPTRSFPASTASSLNFEVIDVSQLIVQSCPAKSEFFVTGRGGLSPTPREVLRSDTALVDLESPPRAKLRRGGQRPTRDHSTENRFASAISSNPTNPPTIITEAQGWVAGPNGEVVLTAQALIAPHSPWMTSAACDGSQPSSHDSPVSVLTSVEPESC